MSALHRSKVTWKDVPTQTITAGGVEFAYRDLGTDNPGTPVVFLIHLAAVLDNWDPRIVDGFAARHRVITFDNRGVGASSGKPASSMEEMAKDAITFVKAMGLDQGRPLRLLDGRSDCSGDRADGAATRAQDDHHGDRPRWRRRHQQGGPRDVPRHDPRLAHGQDPKQFLFFTRTSDGIRAGKEFLERLKERSENRDKAITVAALQAQLKALRRWGTKKPTDLSKVQHPVLVANGDSDRMVPSKNTHDLARRLPRSEVIIYPDSGHGAVFQFHADFLTKALAFLAR